ncbi:MAG: hypothetical protein P8Y47_04305, partial [Alphaproteobacteria bacterium]
MENDEKRKSQDDDNLFIHDDERDEGASDSDSSNMSQSSSSESASSGGLSSEYGMPKLNFSEAGRDRKAAHTAEADAAGQSASDDIGSDDTFMPLGEDTGWESGASIARIGSLNARLNSQETPFVLGPDYLDESNEFTEEPQQANVMPFPGSPMSRPSEEAVPPIFQGMQAEAGFPASYGDYEEELSQDGGDENDDGETLADAVQLALRSVYGNQAEEDDGQDDYMVAGTLMGANASEHELGWSQNAAYPEEEENRYQEEEQEAASAEANTEAVLEYLYGRRRPEFEGIELTLD